MLQGDIGGVTVVGIPARNEAATVAAVARAADAGLQHAFRNGTNVIVLAENGSSDETVQRFLEADIRTERVVRHSGCDGTGKGTNVFAIFDTARELDAERVILLDADVRSTKFDWVEKLAAGVDSDQPRFALPVYRRNRFEGNVTNHLAGPLLAAVFGVHVQQPIGGEFALNRAFLDRTYTWKRSSSSYLYGIDVWLTGNALRENHRISEVPLGRKLHNAPFAKILRVPHQVLDSLFHVVAQLDQVRPQPTDFAKTGAVVDTVATPPDPVVVAHVRAAVRSYLEVHRREINHLFPTARELESAPWGLSVTSDRWPLLLADALEGLAQGHFETSRDHLIALHVNRVMTFWNEIDGLSGDEIDDMLNRAAAETATTVQDRTLVVLV